MTATDASVQSLVRLGRRIRRVPWTWDEGARSAAAAVLALHGVTERETRKQAQKRIQRMARR